MEISDTLVGGALRKGISGGQSACVTQGLSLSPSMLSRIRVSRETAVHRMYSCDSAFGLDIGCKSQPGSFPRSGTMMLSFADSLWQEVTSGLGEIRP